MAAATVPTLTGDDIAQVLAAAGHDTTYDEFIDVVTIVLPDGRTVGLTPTMTAMAIVQVRTADGDDADLSDETIVALADAWRPLASPDVARAVADTVVTVLTGRGPTPHPEATIREAVTAVATIAGVSDTDAYEVVVNARYDLVTPAADRWDFFNLQWLIADVLSPSTPARGFSIDLLLNEVHNIEAQCSPGAVYVRATDVCTIVVSTDDWSRAEVYVDEQNPDPVVVSTDVAVSCPSPATVAAALARVAAQRTSGT